MKQSHALKQMEKLTGDDVGPAAVVGGEDSGADLFVHVQNRSRSLSERVGIGD